jgi:hypothetical protein
MKLRPARGSILFLVTAFALGIILVICLFAMGYIRLVGSGQEQKTAIEAAALAAARDLSKIVIDTDEFGFVGLSDSAPTGTNTAARDNFYSDVISVNTLIGTARLDLLIAGQLDVPEWRTLALQDLATAKVAAGKLQDALNDAILPGGNGVDKDGNTITPYASAEAAYNQNQIRMTGSSTYVAGSMRLTLGAIQGGAATNIPLPVPSGVDTTLDASNSTNGMYKSYVNIPLNGEDFVFAGIGKDVRLLDVKLWVPTVSGLPYQFATVVRAEAIQEVTDATHGSNRIRAMACAQPASIYDPKPAPGALAISFPDGMPDGAERLNTPVDLYNAPFMSDADDDSDFYKSAQGDYPTDTASSIDYDSTWPLASDPNKKASTGCKLAVYDWLKRAGTKANVSSVVGMHVTPFLPQQPGIMWPPLIVRATQSLVPTGVVHVYRFERDGIISYESKKQDPTPYNVVAEDQVLMECHDAIKNGSPSFNVAPVELGPPLSVLNGATEFSSVYDMYIRVYNRRSGGYSGGKHGGEPMDADFTANAETPSTDRKANTGATPVAIEKDTGSLSAPPVIALKNDRSGFASFPNTVVAACGARAMGAKGTAQNVDKGALPIIGPREDFAFKYNLLRLSWDIDRNPLRYRRYATGSGIRRTYQTNGIASEIRFRRLVRAKAGILSLIAEDGYVVLK